MLPEHLKPICRFTLSLSSFILFNFSCTSSKISSSAPRTVPVQSTKATNETKTAENTQTNQNTEGSNRRTEQDYPIETQEKLPYNDKDSAIVLTQNAKFASTSRSPLRELLLSQLAQTTTAERKAHHDLVKSIESVGVRVGNTQQLTTLTLRLNGKLISLTGLLNEDRVAFLRSHSELYGYLTCLDQSPSTCFEQLLELRSKNMGRAAVFILIRRINADFEFENRSYNNFELQKWNNVLLNTEAAESSTLALKTIIVQTTEIISGPSEIEVLLIQRSGETLALHAPLYVAENDSTGLSLTQMTPLADSSLISDLTRQGRRIYLNHRLTAQLVRFQPDSFVELNLKAIGFNTKERNEQLPLLLKLKPQSIRAVQLRDLTH